MKHEYKTKGVCTSNIAFDLDGTTIHNIVFEGGCNGNLKAISKLIEGKEAQDVINLLKGNTCGSRSTSCTDQLTLALEQAIYE